MNFFYHHSVYIKVQKIQDLCQILLLLV